MDNRKETPGTSGGKEYKIRDDQNLLSRTDLHGIITYATQSFVEVSGYSLDELIGSPHSIVRHPDMPPAAFADLWDTLARGEVWVGLVKNRRKNGDYYWVRAHVTPLVEDGTLLGYTSVRVRPSDEDIAVADAAYRRLKAGERAGVRLRHGRLRPSGWRALLSSLSLRSLRSRCLAALGLGGVLVAALAAALFPAAGAAPSAYLPLAALGLLAVLGAHTILVLLHTVRSQVDTATKFAMQIAAGNLATPLPRQTNSSFDMLTAMLEVMRRSLSNIAREMGGNLAQVRPTATQIAEGSTSLAQRTEQQAASLQQTAASMEQITSTVEQNADNARQAQVLADDAANEVRRCGQAMQGVVERMDSISASSAKIADIITVIDGIAFQTNILALNASVEAARAGEHGRGFAVVANEVRSLATRSATAADEVRQLIDASRQQVLSGESEVQQAERTIEAVVAAVLRLNDIMNEIAAASREQSAGIELVNSAVAQMDDVTQRNAGLVQESAQSAQTLHAQVAELANVVGVLRLAGQGKERATVRTAEPAVRPAIRRAPGNSAPAGQPAAAPQRTAVQSTANEEWDEF